MAANESLREANLAVAAAADLVDQLRLDGKLNHAEVARLGFTEAIALAAIDVAVSQRVLAGREVQW